MSNVHASTHPLVQHKLSRLRDKKTEPKQFRELVREISALLAYEATADLAITPREIETPLAKMQAPSSRKRSAWSPSCAPGWGWHFPILRYKRSLAEDSYLGAIYAGRELKEHFNRVLGVDGMLRVTPAGMFQFNALYSATKPDAATKQTPGYSVGLNYGYAARDLDYSLSVNDISEDFSAESGYITRTGILGFAGLFRPKIYPQGGMFQRISLELVSAQRKDKVARMWETYNSVAIRPAFLGSLNATILYAYASEIFSGERFKTGGFQASVSGLLTKQVRASLHSLMVAFIAEHAGGEVRPDGVEICEAGWFEPERLPKLPPRISIARRLIEAVAAELRGR